jgi:Kef-type K+ transport system membrane component KefB
MRWTARSVSGGPTVTAATVLLVLSGAGTQALGYEALFGAFLCGVLIGAHSTEQQIARLQPLNTTVLAFLSPLFFALAGLRIDLTALAHRTTALWALATLAVAVVSKFLGAFAGSAFGPLNRWEAVAVGAGINARGVIQVVIAIVGIRLGLLTTAMYSIIVLIAVATPLMAPPVLKAAIKRAERKEPETACEQRLPPRPATEDDVSPPARDVQGRNCESFGTTPDHRRCTDEP